MKKRQNRQRPNQKIKTRTKQRASALRIETARRNPAGTKITSLMKERRLDGVPTMTLFSTYYRNLIMQNPRKSRRRKI